MIFNYSFPAVKGTQANSDYYICMIPCGLLSKLFVLDSNEILPEYRAQRKINFSRIPEMKKYILSNRDSYVFSALAASIDGDFNFKELDKSGLGILEVDMSATFLINDGQHRKTAIQEAIIEDETIANETIPVVFFKDKGLSRSQQMFSDLNKHAVNTSKSLNTLYDSQDEVAILTRKIVDRISFLKSYTDKENDNLGKFSKMIFTLNNFYNANKKMIEKRKIDEQLEEYICQFWKNVCENINEWNELLNGEITKKSLREDYIVTQGVVLLAFGKLGHYFLENPKLDMNQYLIKLKKINWLRTNEEWNNRTIINGKIARKEENINLTYIQIKKKLGLQISNKEKDLEKIIKK